MATPVAKGFVTVRDRDATVEQTANVPTGQRAITRHVHSSSPPQDMNWNSRVRAFAVEQIPKHLLPRQAGSA
ncbi:hypothetical protein [Sphingomonas abietis]|uniref:Uncharacterized protein n=1 Tax=Sphingomonas abietis TaxID=3012344 RepID=A0ABY7NNS9_9SPHN|nr:hypothetical protein [Sphingomonas abietis]WBO23194.1 hypothetical protein PBT88_03385 [Sphingomonas abietis]